MQCVSLSNPAYIEIRPFAKNYSWTRVSCTVNNISNCDKLYYQLCYQLYHKSVVLSTFINYVINYTNQPFVCRIIKCIITVLSTVLSIALSVKFSTILLIVYQLYYQLYYHCTLNCTITLTLNCTINYIINHTVCHQLNYQTVFYFFILSAWSGKRANINWCKIFNICWLKKIFKFCNRKMELWALCDFQTDGLRTVLRIECRALELKMKIRPI